jgi:hypothetical protein
MEPGLEYGLQTWTIKTPAGDVEAARGLNSWWYEGTGAALIAAHIAEPFQVPGDPACRYKRSYAKELLRFGKRVRFSADRGLRGTNIRILVCRTKAQVAYDDAEEKISRLPRSADDYRERVLGFVEASLNHISTWIDEFGDGYSFDRPTFETFEWAINEANKALEDGKVKFDAAKRARIVNAVRGESVKADTNFQQFLEITRNSGGDHTSIAEP